MIPFTPNEEQINCIKDINIFIKDYKPFSHLLINGSAGTGKTTILISTIVKLLIDQIKQYISVLIDDLVKDKVNILNNLHNFIITAPTNKAKDILVNKYNIYIEGLNISDIIDTITTTTSSTSSTSSISTSSITSTITQDQNNSVSLLKKIIIILSKKITFLTVSQLLSISRVINEMGEEEFTKGNEKKICDKYNKDTYFTTTIIIDECSMIDTHTTKLLNVIKCPLIYIGDYCQLPPVGEAISPTFELDKLCNPNNTNKTITLKIVERCKSDITIIANQLRDKIYRTIPSFNLLTHNAPNIILYNKKFGSWVRTYVKDIKSKQKDLKLICKTIKENEVDNKDMHGHVGDGNNVDGNNLQSNTLDKKKEVFDTIALGWTNKCCMLLNEKIRGHLFEDIENIENLYIIKGDKLLIKTPYYKYNIKIFSSNIVYVANVKKTIYKPLTFKEWCNIIINLNNDDETEQKKPIFDININSMLDSNSKLGEHTLQNHKNIEDYFKVMPKNETATGMSNGNGNGNGNGNSSSSSSAQKTDLREEVKDNLTELLLFRSLFYKHHNLSSRISSDNYIFTDEISLKYNLLIPGYDLHNITRISSNYVRASIYTKWHSLISIKLFGITNDTIGCKKCTFFLNKFINQIKTSININDFIDATENLQFDMYLCDLVSMTSNGKTVYKNIPILNLNNETNSENIKTLRNIIKNSYEVKVMLSRNEERELNSINKMLNEEGNDSETSSKYVTLSQLFGHYMSHIITSCYPEIDYGYALTIHKSQGSTYDDVYIEYANILTNMKENEKLKLLYTAITRSSNKLHIFY